MCINGTCTDVNTCSCKKGYIFTNHSTSVCEPTCDPTCTNGTCIDVNTCRCNDGYAFANASVVNCEPVCNFAGKTCIHSKCVLPNVCKCFGGYRPDPHHLFRCRKILSWFWVVICSAVLLILLAAGILLWGICVCMQKRKLRVAGYERKYTLNFHYILSVLGYRNILTFSFISLALLSENNDTM